MGLNVEEATHVVSHNPFLIAQYHQFKGRDIGATVRALKSVGYSARTMFEDVMRFPSMLSAPPDRILGWYSLLTGYGIVMNGDFIRKAPFIFNLNAPLLFDAESSSLFGAPASTSASEYVVYDALRILEILVDIRIPDINKVVRTQPELLLCSSEDIRERLLYLRHLLSFSTGSASTGSRRRISWAPRRYPNNNSKKISEGKSKENTFGDPSRTAVDYQPRIVRFDEEEVVGHDEEFYSETLRVNVTGKDLAFWKSLLLSNPSILSIEKELVAPPVMA